MSLCIINISSISISINSIINVCVSGACCGTATASGSYIFQAT